MTSTPRSPDDPILNHARLRAVQATGLLDTGAEEPFDRLARLAASILGTPMAFMTLVDDRRSFWKSCIGVDLDDIADRQNTVEESFCQYVVSSGESLIAGDAAKHPVTKDNVSIDAMGVRAWAGFPVKAPSGDVLGTFCVVDIEPRDFRLDQIEALASLAEAAGAEIALRMTVEQLGDVTETLRETLLPPSLPDVPGLELASAHVPADDGDGVLGDFYDVFEADGGWWLSLGDVCGHGPPAAKTTSLARWSIRASAAHADGPVDVARALNAQLLRRPEPDAPHLTLVLAAVRPGAAWEGLVLDLAVSGHPPPRVLRADGSVEVVDATGTALGWFDEISVGEASVTLAPGDALVLFTDGILEARSGPDFFGEEGLDAALGEAAGRNAEGIVAHLIEAANAYAAKHKDDIALLTVRCPSD